MAKTVAQSGKTEPKKWMQGVAKTLDKGGLHRALHVPSGEKIPADRIAKAKNSDNPRVRKMATLAQTFAKARS